MIIKALLARFAPPISLQFLLVIIIWTFSLLFSAILGYVFSLTILLRISIFLLVHHKFITMSIPTWLTHNFVMSLWKICNIIIWIIKIPMIFLYLRRDTPISKASFLSVIGYIFSFFCILNYVMYEALIFASIFISSMIRIIQHVADIVCVFLFFWNSVHIPSIVFDGIKCLSHEIFKHLFVSGLLKWQFQHCNFHVHGNHYHL